MQIFIRHGLGKLSSSVIVTDVCLLAKALCPAVRRSNYEKIQAKWSLGPAVLGELSQHLRQTPFSLLIKGHKGHKVPPLAREERKRGTGERGKGRGGARERETLLNVLWWGNH